MRRWLTAARVLATQPPMPALLAVSACGWILLLTQLERWTTAAPVCGSGWVAASAVDDLGSAAALVSPLAWATKWVMMLMAMTPPLLGSSVARLWRGSLARRRATTLALFFTGYVAAWSTAGAGLQVVAFALATHHSSISLVLVGLAWLAWRLSPPRRLADVRRHRAPRLRVFGAAAFFDSLRYGLGHGGWCALACWPLMLAPFVADHAHMGMMAISAVLMTVDRGMLQSERSVSWRSSGAAGPGPRKSS